MKWSTATTKVIAVDHFDGVRWREVTPLVHALLRIESAPRIKPRVWMMPMHDGKADDQRPSKGIDHSRRGVDFTAILLIVVVFGVSTLVVG